MQGARQAFVNFSAHNPGEKGGQQPPENDAMHHAHAQFFRKNFMLKTHTAQGQQTFHCKGVVGNNRDKPDSGLRPIEGAQAAFHAMNKRALQGGFQYLRVPGRPVGHICIKGIHLCRGGVD